MADNCVVQGRPAVVSMRINVSTCINQQLRDIGETLRGGNMQWSVATRIRLVYSAAALRLNSPTDGGDVSAVYGGSYGLRGSRRNQRAAKCDNPDRQEC